MNFWKSLTLWQQVLIGLVLGVMAGLVLGEHAETWLKPLGTIFLNMIKMLIVPLIFISLVCGITSMQDPSKMGRIGLKAFFMFLLTTAFAISFGLFMGAIFQPGVGFEIAGSIAPTPKSNPGPVATLLGIIPTNPFSAFATGKVLQIIFFAIFVGVSINLVGKKADPLKRLFESAADVVYKMTAIVMAVAPIGVFGLMAWVAGKFGIDVLYSFTKVIVAVYVACILHAFVIIGGLAAILGRISPVKFFKGITAAQAVAFSTTSSSGTLPVTMRCVQDNLGVSKSISSFVLPLGATINMDGTAIYMGVASLFVAQAVGVDLTMSQYATIVLTSTLASIGTAGIPGAGLIMLSLVLTSVGLPLEGVAIIAGIDRVLDMARTTVNVTGDAMVALVVARSENEVTEVSDSGIDAIGALEAESS